MLKGCATRTARLPGSGDAGHAGSTPTIAVSAGAASLPAWSEQPWEQPARADGAGVPEGWERRYGKDIALIGDDRVEIDLHLALVAGYFGITMPTVPLLQRLVTYEVADRPIPALDAMGRLLHACIHTASTTPIRLGSAADVVQIAGSGDVDDVEFAAFAMELRCDAIVARGLARAWDAFGAEPTELSEWARRNRPDDRERKALAASTVRGETKWQSGLDALPPWKRPATYCRCWCRRAHLRHRHRSYLDHLRISARRLSPGRR